MRKNKINTKKDGSKAYVIIVYLIIPFLITAMIYLTSYKYLIKYMSTINIGSATIYNSKHTVEIIFTPFISSLLLIISLLAAIIIIKVINHICDKNDVKFDVKFSKKIIFGLTILTSLIAIIALFYSHFEYWSYGIENIDKASGYFHLEPIPSIRGGNITSNSAPIPYQIMHFFANLIKQIIGKFNLIITIASAILIPLKIKIEKSKEK